MALASGSLVCRPGLRASTRVSRSTRVITVCKAHKVAVLPGDGIGPEIMDAALKVLTAAGKKEGETFEFKHALIGGAAIDATGSPLPQESLDICKASDAVLLAAIGGCAASAAAAAAHSRCPACGSQLAYNNCEDNHGRLSPLHGWPRGAFDRRAGSCSF